MPWLAAVGGALGTAAGAIGSGLGAAGSAIGSGLGAAGTAVGQAAGPLATGIADTASTVGSKLGSALGEATGMGPDKTTMQNISAAKNMAPGRKSPTPGPQLAPVNSASQVQTNSQPNYSQLMDYLGQKKAMK